MWRRLGPRISVPAPPPPPVRPAAGAGRRGRARRPVAAPAPLPPPPLPPPPPESAPAAAADADQTTLVRPYTPAREPTFEPTLPRLKLGLRRFDFVRIGAVEFARRRRRAADVQQLLRRRLSGVEGGAHRSVVAVRLAVGRLRHERRLLRGADAVAGRPVSGFRALRSVRGGVRRRRLHAPPAVRPHRPDASTGISASTSGRRSTSPASAIISLAIGYMRPVNGFARGRNSQPCSSTPGRSRSASGSDSMAGCDTVA